MALMRAVYEGVDDIMDFYDCVNPEGEYNYSVWYSLRDIAFQYHKNDAEQGRKYLEDNLKALEQAGSKDLFYIKFHPGMDKGYITKKTPIISTTPVRINSLEGEEIIAGVPASNPSVFGNSANGGMYRMMQEMAALPGKLETAIDNKMLSMEERIKALEQPQPEQKDFLSQINGLLQNEALVKGVFGFLNNIVKPPQTPYSAINGVTPNPQIMEQNNNEEPIIQPEAKQAGDEHIVDNDKLEAALDRLNNIILLDDDLTLMADFAEKSPEMFGYFLQQLRTQK